MSGAADTTPGAVPEFKQVMGHPRPLWMLFMTEFWERFAFYGIRWALVLYVVAQFYSGNPEGEAPAGLTLRLRRPRRLGDKELRPSHIRSPAPSGSWGWLRPPGRTFATAPTTIRRPVSMARPPWFWRVAGSRRPSLSKGPFRGRSRHVSARFPRAARFADGGDALPVPMTRERAR